MVNYFLQGLGNSWFLVRETPHSQQFKVDILQGIGLKALINIHYTRPSIAHVSVTWIGEEAEVTDQICNSVFGDLSKIICRHGGYQVIDYSFTYSKTIFEGNYNIGN